MGVGGVVAMVVVVVVVGEADGVVVVVEDVAVGVVVAVVVVLMVMEAAVVVVFLGAGAEVGVDVAIPAVAVLLVVVDEAIPAGGDVEMVVVLGNSRLSLSQDSAGSQCSHVTGSVGESQYSDFRMNHAPIVVEHLLDTDY